MIQKLIQNTDTQVEIGIGKNHIKVVCNGVSIISKLIDGNLLRVGDLELDIDKRILKKAGEAINITTVQFNILQQLAQNPGRIFERYDLIHKVYDTADLPDIFDRTMDSHIKNIRKLIEIDSRNPKYILTVRGVGYKFNENV